MAASMEEWICQELKRILQFDATDDIAKYILAIENEDDLQEYMYELLDKRDSRSRRFVKELLSRWRPPARQVSSYVPENVQVYQKFRDDDLSYQVSNSKQKKKKAMSPASEPSSSLMETNNSNGVDDPQESEIIDHKKKSKFVPLFNNEGSLRTAAKIPGRHACECQASKHKLINNCVNCGRVICEQEGSGPCFFCGTLVCTTEEQEVLNRGSKKSEKLREKLMEKQGGGILGKKMLPNMAAEVNEGMRKALEHKNKLLDYDKTSVKRTQVIDDESDYFSTDTNQWLSTNERESLRKREEELRSVRHASRKDRKVTLDFAGRKIVEEEQKVNMYDIDDNVVQRIHYGKNTDPENRPNFTHSDFTDLSHPRLTADAPQFVPTVPQGAWAKKTSQDASNEGSVKGLRLQDRELQEMVDEGMCMSMHQPWASLLIAGIKLHEGRSWYTTHRGRLWIAATAQKPNQPEVDEMENHYRAYFNRDNLPFPEDYPVGCLLGCVDVEDCLPQDEYRDKHPDGDSSSPYVFICTNPYELIVKFPLKGKHKIFVVFCPFRLNMPSTGQVCHHPNMLIPSSRKYEFFSRDSENVKIGCVKCPCENGVAFRVIDDYCQVLCDKKARFYLHFLSLLSSKLMEMHSPFQSRTI